MKLFFKGVGVDCAPLRIVDRGGDSLVARKDRFRSYGMPKVGKVASHLKKLGA
ncbi:hypothetical protein [Rhodanobacter ginsengiterrae]|uniref:hypothetical protein n=1 Tax=Rhodanobacter ginsengiterrae TaxID=2008451 RepID=UPI003CF1BAD6